MNHYTQNPIKLFTPYKRVVIKIGTAILVDKDGMRVREDWLKALIEDIMALRQAGKEVLIVTSGSIALGRTQLGWPLTRALKLEEKQAAAAVGQPQLVASYANAFKPHGVEVAQILLTYQDTEERNRHLNARHSIVTLLEMGYVPIINENDTVATAEIRYGDNDRLAARVASMVSADLVILLSDIDGLYSANPNDPKTAKNAHHIPEIHEIDQTIMAMAGRVAQSGFSSGGMKTKLEAAKIAVAGGAALIIAKGDGHHPLICLDKGGLYSLFHPSESPLQARKSWIAGTLTRKGTIIIDEGAYQALQRGSSLLPSGVKIVEGEFQRGDPVAIALEGQDNILAMGLTSYDSNDAKRIQGQHTSAIHDILGYGGRNALIHRDDLALTKET